MLNMNRATLVGHAGRDPEIRDLRNGEKAASFTMATTERWKDREGQPAESTEWHRIVVYGHFSDRMTELNYRVKATSAGRFTLPAAFAGSMYDRSIQARTRPGRIEVESLQ